MNLKDKTLWQRNAAAIGGMVLFAAGINFFIVPASLYNGGVLGISQIIRTLLIQVFPSLASGTDIAGIINFILNIPLFIMAYISIGKSFFSRTLVCLISQTIFLSIFPIPATPLVNDSLTASIMGGLLAGTGIGISLRSGRYVLYQEIQKFQRGKGIFDSQCCCLRHMCDPFWYPDSRIQHYLFRCQYSDD